MTYPPPGSPMYPDMPPSGMAYPPGPPRAPAAQRSTVDLVIASLLALVYLAGTALILFFSLFAVMATDACSDVRPCDYDMLTYGYLVLWGGSAGIVLALVAGMIWMFVRRQWMSWIPLSAIVLEVAVVVVAVALAQQMQ
ncbi:hypothetical protein ACWDTI_01090 [Gordonia sp. NPDC003424]